MALDAQCLGNESQRLLATKEEVVCTQEMFSNNASIANDKNSNMFLEPVETGSNRCLLPILVDDTDIGVVNEVVGAEDTGAGGDMSSDVRNEEVMVRREAIPLQSKVPMSSGRGRRSQIRYRILEDTDYNDQDGLANKLLMNSDPRTTMHYVKYIKRDGKTHKIWECGICGKEFSHQYTLMRHLPTHTDERNFKCETCGKGFRQMSTLSQHRAIHSDARPYVCEVCTKTFNRVSTLISHRKTHSDHKPHKCHVCGKGFHQKGNLRNHVFTHTNERPYKCEVCGKGFNQMSNLMCHKMKAHAQGDKTHYSCTVCKMEFPRKYALKSHEQYSHGMKRSGDTVIIGKMDPSQYPGLSHQPEDDNKSLQYAHFNNSERNENIRDYISKSFAPHRLTKIMTDVENVGHESNTSLGIIIDPINTKAMTLAKQSGQTPFALLKLAKGNPVLVKVVSTPLNKHMLVPASADDLKTAEEITISPNTDPLRNGTLKALQIKVPIVATVIQQMDSDGHMTMHVESPGYNPDISNLFEESADMTAMCRSEASMQIEHSLHANTYLGCNTNSNSNNPAEDACRVNSINLIGNSTSNSGLQGLMSMESNGEIQFMYPAMDGMSYQVLSPEEAVQIMQHPGQTIEVVSEDLSDGNQEQSVQNTLVSENHLPGLVDAICSDYQINTTSSPMLMTQSEFESFGMAVNQQAISYSHNDSILPC